MQQYLATYAAPGEPGGTATVLIAATHYSVSGSGTAQFYKRTGTPRDGERGNDVLVGSVHTPLSVQIDEKAAVVEGFIVEDLSEELAEAVMKALGLAGLDEDVKIRVAVTLL